MTERSLIDNNKSILAKKWIMSILCTIQKVSTIVLCVLKSRWIAFPRTGFVWSKNKWKGSIRIWFESHFSNWPDLTSCLSDTWVGPTKRHFLRHFKAYNLSWKVFPDFDGEKDEEDDDGESSRCFPTEAAAGSSCPSSCTETGSSLRGDSGSCSIKFTKLVTSKQYL